MKNENDAPVQRLLNQRQILINYLLMKVEAEDWHAVCDAGMDLRELDMKLYKRVLK